jgi:hypothetical protein
MHRLGQGGGQLVLGERLEKPSGFAGTAVAKIAMPGHENERDFAGGRIVAQTIGGLEARHGRHHHITKDGGWLQDPSDITGVLYVVGGENTVATMEQKFGKHGAHLRIVFDDYQRLAWNFCDVVHQEFIGKTEVKL